METQSLTDISNPATLLPLRIMLVDDNPRFLRVTADFLALDSRLEVIAMILSTQRVLEEIKLYRPDLVLMDVAMPGVNGLELTRQVKAQPDAPLVIILTLHNDPEYRTAAQRVGADGFVAKADLGMELLPLIYRLFKLAP